MPTALHLAGPQHPAAAVPPRAPRSIRRTTTIDSDRPDGLGGPVVVDARGRDLLTAADGTATIVATEAVQATLAGAGHAILSITCASDEPRLAGLVGAVVGPGFRARMTGLLPDRAEGGGLLYLLLDDWVGATLVSGYSLQRSWLDTDAPRLPAEHLAGLADICSGWETGAGLMDMVSRDGVVPTPMGPVEPPAVADDPWATHETAPRRPTGTRRARRIDVAWADGVTCTFDCHFRDSYAEPSGAVTVIHEYSATGTFDLGSGLIGSIEADPLVLPWTSCPAAIASARRVVGMPVRDLRARVRRELVGTSTCTHLNDTLRELADIGALAARLGA